MADAKTAVLHGDTDATKKGLPAASDQVLVGGSERKGKEFFNAAGAGHRATFTLFYPSRVLLSTTASTQRRPGGWTVSPINCSTTPT